MSKFTTATQEKIDAVVAAIEALKSCDAKEYESALRAALSKAIGGVYVTATPYSDDDPYVIVKCDVDALYFSDETAAKAADTGEGTGVYYICIADE